MAERYTRLASLPENQYAVGSPILITAGALLKDNQTGKALAQVKFKNISEKQIKAIKISVSAFDVSGKELDGVAEYQYLDLTAARTAEFGHKQAVTLPDAVTRSIEVKCTDVFFTDGTVWTAAPDAIWTSLPTQKSVTEQLGDLAAQYQRDTTPKSKFIPIEYEDLWFCSCGEINHNEESKCHNCRHDKTALFAGLDIDALRQRDAEYKAAEAKKAEKQAAADKVQRAKTTKFTITAAAVIVVIVAASLLTTKVIIPNSKYNNAVTLMNAGKYEDAIAAFEALDGHRDSVDKIVECETVILDGKYNNAVTLMDAERYEDALKAFMSLGNYADSVSMVAKLEKEVIYISALDALECKDYAVAYAKFVELGDFKDSLDYVDDFFYLPVASSWSNGGSNYEHEYKYLYEIGADNQLVSIEVQKMDGNQLVCSNEFLFTNSMNPTQCNVKYPPSMNETNKDFTVNFSYQFENNRLISLCSVFSRNYYADRYGKWISLSSSWNCIVENNLISKYTYKTVNDGKTSEGSNMYRYSFDDKKLITSAEYVTGNQVFSTDFFEYRVEYIKDFNNSFRICDIPVFALIFGGVYG